MAIVRRNAEYTSCLPFVNTSKTRRYFCTTEVIDRNVNKQLLASKGLELPWLKIHPVCQNCITADRDYKCPDTFDAYWKYVN